MEGLYDNLLAEQDEYEKRCRACLSGELELDAFLPYASSMGIYRQKREGTWMVRPRILSGMLTNEQLEGIVAIADRYAYGKIHLTIRQDIQFHGLSLEDTIGVALGLKELGLFNKGAGGNSIRNIVCPATSGLDDEVFDVSSDAVKGTRFALNLPDITTLPRKYKISFSNNDKDFGRVLFADLGFMAAVREGVYGFEVYGAGGLGNKPTTGMLLEGFIERDAIFEHILAMKYLFEDHGDRTNRSKARIRFIRERLGDEAFVKLYREYVVKARQALVSDEVLAGLLARAQEVDATPFGDGVADRNGLSEAKAAREFIELNPEDGDLKTEVLHRLLSWVKEQKIEQRVEVRLTIDQGILLRYLTAREKAWLAQSFEGLVAKTPIEQSISCTGATNCRIGLCDSVSLRKEVIALGRRYEPEQRQRLPRLYISGCRNSCGWHWIGSLGFSGAKIRRDGESVEAYNVTIDGRTGRNASRLGTSVGTLAKDRVTDFLEGVFEDYLSKADMSFEDYVRIHASTIHEQITLRQG